MKALRLRTFCRRRNAVTGLITATVIALFLQSSASGGFIGDYSTSRFTLTNVDADGWFEVVSDGSVLHLYGGNSGTGMFGTTDLFITASLAGLFSFSYSYASLDSPGYDRAGYLVNGLFTALADADGQSGEVKLPLLAGDVFGFRILTDDNMGEPGILTITRFTAPESPGTVVPETASVWMLAGAGFVLALRKRSR